MIRKPPGYWNKIRCIETAKLCTAINIFQSKYGSAYNAARKNGWLHECCIHMEELKHFRSKEECLCEAKKYNHISDFQKNRASVYQKIRTNNWQGEAFVHMEKLGNHFKRLIYAVIFPDKNIYIGLTCNPTNRFAAHLKDVRSAPYKHSIKTGLHPEFIKLTDFLDKNIAAKQEEYFRLEYLKQGYKILNKAKTGGLGGNILKWTKEKCVEVVRNCKTKTEFRNKYGGAYNAVYKNNWFNNIIFPENYKPINYWNIKNIYNAAKECKNPTEFNKKYSGAYKILNLKINNKDKENIYTQLKWYYKKPRTKLIYNHPI